MLIAMFRCRRNNVIDRPTTVLPANHPLSTPMSHHARLAEEQHVQGATPYLFAARDELASLDDALCDFEVVGFKFHVYSQRQSL